MREVDREKEAFCKEALALGRGYAFRAGLPREEVEDCSMDFLTKMLLHYEKADPAQPLPPNRLPWLRTCARRHTLNFCRYRNLRLRLQAQDFAEEEQPTPLVERLPTASTPEKEMLWADFWEEFIEAIEQLEAAPEALFVAHYFEGRQAWELAERSGRTRDAVEQSLARSRRRLRKRLEALGWTEQSVREYLLFWRCSRFAGVLVRVKLPPSP